MQCFSMGSAWFMVLGMCFKIWRFIVFTFMIEIVDTASLVHSPNFSIFWKNYFKTTQLKLQMNFFKNFMNLKFCHICLQWLLQFKKNLEQTYLVRKKNAGCNFYTCDIWKQRRLDRKIIKVVLIFQNLPKSRKVIFLVKH